MKAPASRDLPYLTRSANIFRQFTSNLIDQKKIDAKLNDGVLTPLLKAEAAIPRKIEIKS